MRRLERICRAVRQALGFCEFQRTVEVIHGGFLPLHVDVAAACLCKAYKPRHLVIHDLQIAVLRTRFA